MDASIDHHQWLPMPSGISFTHKTFANDLLEHFNIDKTDLDWESDEEPGSIKSPSLYSTHNNSIKEPESLPHNIPSTSQQQKTPKRNLLRKSSVYLFKRHESGTSIKSDEQQQQQQQQQQSQHQHQNQRASALFHSLTLRRKNNFYRPAEGENSKSSVSLPPSPLSKVAVQTTIQIPNNNTNTNNINNNTRYSYNTHPLHHHHHHHPTAVQPPIITNYPPKPLKYSPVEPLPEQEHSAKKILHRISLPLLRLTNHDHTVKDTPVEDASSSSATMTRQIKRRRSDSEVYRSKESSLLGTFGKRWNKLLFSCGIKKPTP